MFFPGSRYLTTTTYSFTRADGSTVMVTRPPTPGPAAVVGYYRRQTDDRLDQIAGRFVSDATAFWRICDSNNALSPDALGARALVGIPLGAAVRA
jgi:hypothetical protein